MIPTKGRSRSRRPGDVVTARSARSASSISSFVRIALASAAFDARLRRGLARLDRGQDRVGPLRRVGVALGEAPPARRAVSSGSSPGLPISPTVDLVDVGARVAEQALVDVADLLDVDVAERDPPRGLALELGHLHRAQHLQHHPVADRDRERAALAAGGEEREPVGVEQRPAVRRQPQVLERRAAVERQRGREQPVPGQVRGVQRLAALRAAPGRRGRRARR